MLGKLPCQASPGAQSSLVPPNLATHEVLKPRAGKEEGARDRVNVEPAGPAPPGMLGLVGSSAACCLQAGA